MIMLLKMYEYISIVLTPNFKTVFIYIYIYIYIYISFFHDSLYIYYWIFFY